MYQSDWSCSVHVCNDANSVASFCSQTLLRDNLLKLSTACVLKSLCLVFAELENLSSEANTTLLLCIKCLEFGAKLNYPNTITPLSDHKVWLNASSGLLEPVGKFLAGRRRTNPRTLGVGEHGVRAAALCRQCGVQKPSSLQGGQLM